MIVARIICTIVTFCISMFSGKLIAMNLADLEGNPSNTRRLLYPYHAKFDIEKLLAPKEYKPSNESRGPKRLRNLHTDEKLDLDNLPKTKKDLKLIEKVCRFTPDYLSTDMINLILRNAPRDTVTQLAQVCKYFYTYYANNFLDYIRAQRKHKHLSIQDLISTVRLRSFKDYRKKHGNIIKLIKDKNPEILQTVLTDKSTDLLYADMHGNSFLHTAVLEYKYCAESDVKRKNVLIQAIIHLAKDSHLVNMQNRNGETAIMLAGNMAIVNLLSDKTDLTILSKTGENALYRLLNALCFDDNRRACAEFFFKIKRFDPSQTLIVRGHEVKLSDPLYRIFPKKNEADRVFLQNLLGYKYDESEYERLNDNLRIRLDFMHDHGDNEDMFDAPIIAIDSDEETASYQEASNSQEESGDEQATIVPRNI